MKKYILEEMLLIDVFGQSHKKMLEINFSIIERQKLPTTLEFTSRFTTLYLQILKSVIPKKLTEVFKWHEFYHHQNDSTRSFRVVDLVFWKNISFHFTQNGANALWQTFLKKNTNIWKKTTPWDILLLKILFDKKIKHQQEWLLDKSAHWTIIAYFLLVDQDKFMYQKFPYLTYFQKQDKIAYPLRFILIELAANYYKKVTNVLEEAMKSTIEDSHHRINIQHRDFWVWLEKMEKELAIQEVSNAYNYWCNIGAIGYDDQDFLKNQEKKVLLIKNINALKAIKKSLGKIR